MPLSSKFPAIELITDIVWIQTSFIGDIILTTAAVELVAQKMPHVKQHFITTSAGQSLLQSDKRFDSVHVFNKAGGMRSILETARTVRRSVGRQPVILQPHRSFRSSILSKCLGFPSVTYLETKLSFLATRRIPRVAVLHETDRIALLLEGLGMSRSELLGSKPQLRLSRDAPLPQNAQTFFCDKPFVIAIAPGSNWGTKRWPLERYKELALTLLQKHPQAKIILLGSSEERSDCEHVRNYVQAIYQTRILNLAGDTKLDQLPTLYKKINLLICNDSSPVHFASAADVPTIAIFGSTVPALGFSPLAHGSVVVEHAHLECRPCSDHGPMTCPLGHFKCMRDISVDMVLDACNKVLNVNSLTQPDS